MKKIFKTVVILQVFLIFFVVQLEAANTKYTCPMHPHYISDTEGACPICGMDLVPIEVDSGDESSVGGDNDHKDHNSESAGIQFSTNLVQRTGYRSEVVEQVQFGRLIRSFGEVVPNKRLQSNVSLRVDAWVEQLVVNAPGDLVKKGDILFTVYSPQLISAQQDYLAALKSRNKGRMQSSRERLYSLGVERSVVESLRKSGQSLKAVPFFAPTAGRIENLNIRAGSYLKSGAIALRIQKYETVWVKVNLAEQDISFVEKNSVVNIQFPNLNVYQENVTIDYISPTINPATRTAELRLLVENSEGNIRPGAYADVEIHINVQPRLAMPYESVLQNKMGNYVIRDLGENGFKSQKVTLGIRSKGRVEVVTGLQEGDLVVTSGQFLIDSESSLRESFKKMEKLSAELRSLSLTKEQLNLMNHIIEAALYVHDELAAKRFPAPEVLLAGERAVQKLLPELAGTRLSYVLHDSASILQKRENQQSMNDWKTFLKHLTVAIKPWVVDGQPNYYKNLGLKAFEDEKGLFWIQFEGAGVNPYSSDSFKEISLVAEPLTDGVIREKK